jgi:hypothetical protein
MIVSTATIAPGCDHHRQPKSLIAVSPSGDRDPLARTRLPRLLALEAAPRRQPSTNRFRDARADPADKPREPAAGALRIHGELLMLGIDVAESTIVRYAVWPRRPPSQSWKTFLCNYAAGIASIDLFVVRIISFTAHGLVVLRRA